MNADLELSMSKKIRNAQFLGFCCKVIEYIFKINTKKMESECKRICFV